MSLVEIPHLLESHQFAELFEADVDAIVVWPVDPNSLAPSIAEANERGIPVFTIDNPADPSLEVLQDVTGSVLMGRDFGPYEVARVASEINPGGKYVVLGNAAPSAGLTFWAESQDHWAKEFGLEFLGREDAATISYDAAAQAMSGILGRFPDVEIVFAYNDDAALAASGIARTNGREDILITGVNGESALVAAIEQGQSLLSYEVMFEEMGQEAARGAILATLGEQVPSIVVVRGSVVGG